MKRIEDINEFLLKLDNDYLRSKVIKFLMSGERLNEVSIRKFAEDQHVDVDDVYEVLFMILEDFFHHGHYQDKIKQGDIPFFDEKELRIGSKIEREHTAGPIMAELIAKDHLVEDPKYYSKLKKMLSK